MRADYCAEVLGQWSPTRSFRSVFPPDFNLNSVPGKVDFGRRLVIGGQLKNNGAVVKKARLYLERRIYPKRHVQGPRASSGPTNRAASASA